MLEPWALAHKRFKKMLAWHIYQKRILNLASALHATSSREAKNLHGLGLKARIETIPWGIELPDARSRICEFGRKNGFRTALFVGRIYPVKGLPMLVEAWARVRPLGWKMQIVGPDEAGHRAEVESLVRKAGLNADFTFTGTLHGTALREAYEGADLFILPSHTENFSMVVGEALAHGVPVIATQGAPWEMLTQEGCGWRVPASVDGIAEALSTAAACSMETLHSMGDAGRCLVADRFSWRTVAMKFGALYEALI
jgi:glycosyltransferase involved in cell wall biosynthesis